MPTRLNKKDILNLMDALTEWNEIVGAKELDDSEIGLDGKVKPHIEINLLRKNNSAFFIIAFFLKTCIISFIE